MTQARKYEVQVVQKDSKWSAEIVRRVTSKKTTVSKMQDGFASEAEAKTWGDQELKVFLKKLKERNQISKKKPAKA